MNRTIVRHIVAAGVSLPTFTVSPSVAKATVYMPSQVAARVLGGRPARKDAPQQQSTEDVPAPRGREAA